MLITPQEYFNNPFHFTFENYFIRRTDDVEYSAEINRFIYNFHDNSSFCYFIIDWYFIYSKFKTLDDELEDIEGEENTEKYIVEVLNFLDPNMYISLDEDELNGKVVIVKLKKVLRNLQKEILREEEIGKHINIFKDYKNLKCYCN